MLKKFKGARKRAIILCAVFCISFSLCVLRLIYIQNSLLAQVADAQFTRSLVLGETRGYIYDRNMKPLVNIETEEKTVLLTNAKTNGIIKNKYNFNENEIKNGILISFAENINAEDGEYIRNFYNVNRYSDESLCRHIIGYLDSSGMGVCGIEKAFEKILDEASGKLKAFYGANASGFALAGEGIDIIDENYDSPAGLSLTIDKDIQRIVEKALNNSDITSGAAVIMDVNTFEILAITSVPYYDPLDVASSLNDENLPFLNRAFCAYPAGSVFKPFVAAAALENGWNISESFECKGYLQIGGNTFRCFNSNIHGKEDLNLAIEKSCNTFFIDLGLKTGVKKLIETVEKFGFGTKTQFCSTLIAEEGNLPEAGSVTSDSQLANLCFGQGELLVTPVQLAAAYSVLANGGTYKEPVLLKELIDDNKKVYGYYKSETEYEAVKKETCELICTALYNNMINGTGVNGASDIVTSAGKTATAQTGKYDSDNNEQLCTWFAGFFPFDEPKYSVVVFNEKGSTASVDCAPVFREIIEEITKLQGVQEVF
ncbi:MAG: penicillin-binding protein 2 [Clostridia bacterium]|nr:penicillin-binding protein 2 [Clostridia bacterium]